MNQVNFLQATGWSLLNSLWQMALLWAVYKLIIVAYNHKIRPRHKTSLAFIFTIGGFAWFIYTFLSTLITASVPEIPIGYAGLLSDSSWNYFASKILPYASIVYFVILIVPSWQFIRNYRYVQFIRKYGLKKIEVEWRLYATNRAAAMGIKRKVNIWLSEWVSSPVTIGYLKPIILIPVAAINNLTPQQLEAVILHELSHIYRYDYFLNLILSFIKTTLYFNPFVKQLVKEIEREREYSCDEMVLQYQYKPGEYASALLRLEQSKHRQMVMAAAGKNHDLLHRIESILGMRNKGWNPVKHISFAVLTMLGVVLLHLFIAATDTSVKQGYYTLSNEASPYYFLYGKNAPANNFIANASWSNPAAKKNTSANTAESDYTFVFADDVPAPSPFMQAGFNTPEMPELAPEEEVKVKEAIDATKKILQESEWKAMEKTYADALTSYEKNKLRSEYIHEIDKKADWHKLEDQLRLAYQQINWDNVDQKLKSSLAQIKLDSIQCQLNINLGNLYKIETLLKENNITVIPDTEISLQAVQENQQKAKEQLIKLKAARPKKIVRL